MRRMAVLNDFEANGYGVTALEPEHLVVLNDVPSTPKVPSRLRSHIHGVLHCQPLSMTQCWAHAKTVIARGAMADPMLPDASKRTFA